MQNTEKDETKRTHADCQSFDFAAHFMSYIEYLQLNLGPHICGNEVQSHIYIHKTVYTFM